MNVETLATRGAEENKFFYMPIITWIVNIPKLPKTFSPLNKQSQYIRLSFPTFFSERVGKFVRLLFSRSLTQTHMFSRTFTEIINNIVSAVESFQNAETILYRQHKNSFVKQLYNILVTYSIFHPFISSCPLESNNTRYILWPLFLRSLGECAGEPFRVSRHDHHWGIYI